MEEQEQIVVIPHVDGSINAGDYVFASRWSDADWCDPWHVGFVERDGGDHIQVVGSNRIWWRAMKITPEQGAYICRAYPSLERNCTPLCYRHIAKVFLVN